MKKPLEMAHDFLTQVITKDDVVVDATMGNGHDTLFLAKLAKQVYAFDIQEQALEKTSQRLQEAGLTNVELLLQGHETVDQFVTEVKAAIFNLGYLPTADKSIITKPHTTTNIFHHHVMSFTWQAVNQMGNNLNLWIFSQAFNCLHIKFIGMGTVNQFRSCFICGL